MVRYVFYALGNNAYSLETQQTNKNISNFTWPCNSISHNVCLFYYQLDNFITKRIRTILTRVEGNMGLSGTGCDRIATHLTCFPAVFLPSGRTPVLLPYVTKATISYAITKQSCTCKGALYCLRWLSNS
jgi:hypothetical protein